MRATVGLDALEAGAGSSVTIGTFDGVHLGHRALTARAIDDARERRVRSVAVTWDRHPNETLRPEKTPPLLTTSARKVELLEEMGLDQVAVLPFDEELSQWPPERFAEQVLAEGLGVHAVFVGEGWRFGHRAAGDVSLLDKLGQELGFEVHEVRLVEVDGEPVSSTRTRLAVSAGEMELARALLARPFDLDGVVIRGAERGHSLGFPTANLALEPALAHPARGVYAGRARAGEQWYPAAINLGVNPTFGGDPTSSPLRVEAYLLGFSGDLYGQTLRVEFWQRLRDEIKFDGRDALVEQMRTDVERTAALLGA